jgi:hypothetical protein
MSTTQMQAAEPQETVVPADISVEDVMRASGGELTPEQFAILARAARTKADATPGDCEAKWKAFRETLIADCTKFGDPIARNFIQVARPDVVGTYWWFFTWGGNRLEYFETGADKHRYVAIVF